MLSEGKLFIWFHFHPESGKSRPRLFSFFTFSLPAPRGTSAAALAWEEKNKVIGSPPPEVGAFDGSQIKLCAAVVDALSGSEGFPFGERR